MNTNMLKRLTLLAWVLTPLLGLADDTRADRIYPGVANCKFEATEDACSIKWDFSRAPRSYYQVQALDVNSPNNWLQIGSPIESFYSMSPPVVGGKLYRVAGCDDRAMKRNCVYSTVQWAIERPDIDSLPDYMVDASGTKMHISKSAPAGVQIAQYNVYRLVQLLDRIDDLSALPEMTDPNSGVIGRVSDNVNILDGVFVNYRERRLSALTAKK